MRVCEECVGLMPVTQTNEDTIVVCTKMCCCILISEFDMLMGSAMMDVQP